MKKIISAVFVASLFVSIGTPEISQASLIDLGAGSFTPLATVITFSEKAYGTIDPVYSFLALPELGDITVSFGGHFVGQTAGGGSPNTLTDFDPDGPLALDPSAPDTFITGDGSNPTSPVLSGTPLFNGPISVLFSKPVAGVGLDGGYFNAIGGTSIQAYDASGNILGSIVNDKLGIEFFGLADSTGANVISGISFFITGAEPYGFGIDNLTFGAKGSIKPINPVPEPTTMLLFGAGLAGLAGLRLKKKA